MRGKGPVSFLVFALPLLLLAAASSRLLPKLARTQKALIWYSDLAEARKEARQKGKPLFIVFRDERDKLCKRFDDQVVGLDSSLSDVEAKFVLVRIGDMRGVDLNLFDFDYDLTWMGFFMNANAHVYGRFGGRDASEAEGHLTIPGLRYAMERALAAYQRDPHALGPPPAPPRRVEQNPLVAEQIAAPECIHCHHVYQYRRDAMRRTGRWRNAMAWVYPWPENIGLTVDLNQPDHIQRVKPGSAAASAGIRAGDVVKTLNGDPIASYGDIQYALQRAPAEGSIPIRWAQGGQERTAELALAKGWRETDLSWRASMWRLSPAPSVEGQDLTPEEKAKYGLPADHLAFRQYDMVWPNAKAAGIQGGDIIIGLDDKPFAMTMMQFLIHIRMHYKAGDRVVFNLYRNGQRMDIPMVLGDNP
jgi:hypothetical protein